MDVREVEESCGEPRKAKAQKTGDELVVDSILLLHGKGCRVWRTSSFEGFLKFLLGFPAIVSRGTIVA